MGSIYFSPISERIFVAVGKERNGRFVASQKVERTSDFLAALVDYCCVGYEREIETPEGKTIVITMKEKEENGAPVRTFSDGSFTVRVGKKRAGRLLDGREWNEMPEVNDATL